MTFLPYRNLVPKLKMQKNGKREIIRELRNLRRFLSLRGVPVSLTSLKKESITISTFIIITIIIIRQVLRKNGGKNDYVIKMYS